MSGCHPPVGKIEQLTDAKEPDKYTELLNRVGKLSMDLNKMESSLREFEKQRHNPLLEYTKKQVEELQAHLHVLDVKVTDLQESWMELKINQAEQDE